MYLLPCVYVRVGVYLLSLEGGVPAPPGVCVCVCVCTCSPGCVCVCTCSPECVRVGVYLLSLGGRCTCSPECVRVCVPTPREM